MWQYLNHTQTGMRFLKATMHDDLVADAILLPVRVISFTASHSTLACLLSCMLHLSGLELDIMNRCALRQTVLRASGDEWASLFLSLCLAQWSWDVWLRWLWLSYYTKKYCCDAFYSWCLVHPMIPMSYQPHDIACTAKTTPLFVGILHHAVFTAVCLHNVFRHPPSFPPSLTFNVVVLSRRLFLLQRPRRIDGPTANFERPIASWAAAAAALAVVIAVAVHSVDNLTVAALEISSAWWISREVNSPWNFNVCFDSWGHIQNIKFELVPPVMYERNYCGNW